MLMLHKPLLLFLAIIISYNNSLCHGCFNSPTKTAVVVGGGPAGLASALLLSRKHGFEKVTVIESSKEIDVYDSSKAYLYNINRRGQVFTNLFPEIHQRLIDLGVGISKFERMTVPADPKELFTNVPFSRDLSAKEKEQLGTLYWIPRHLFVKIMLDELLKEKSVQILTNTNFRGMEPNNNINNSNNDSTTTENGGVCVKAEIVGQNKTVTLNASLVVGADGYRSKVRDILANPPKNNNMESPISFNGWSNYKPRNFKVKQYNSPSVGLRIKSLQVQPSFLIPVGDGTMAQFNNSYSYQIQSVNKGMTDQISITLLPQKDVNAKKPVLMATLPNHDLWKIKSGKEMKKFFTKAFPRFSFDDTTKGCLVAQDEWERFAQSEGSKFPPCQYSPNFYISSPNGQSGIVLVGDAIHAFPPDVGQGVNVALGDVCVLDECLSSKNTSTQPNDNDNNNNLGNVLAKYQKIRKPETKALVHMAKVAAPFQYRQTSYKILIQKFLWTFNVALRTILNKLSGGFLPKPAVVQMMNASLSFRTIMIKADTLTVCLWSTLIAIIWRVLMMVKLTAGA